MRAALHLHTADSPWLSSLIHACTLLPRCIVLPWCQCRPAVPQNFIKERRVKGSARELWTGISICSGTGRRRCSFPGFGPPGFEINQTNLFIRFFHLSSSETTFFLFSFSVFVQQWDLIVFLPPHGVLEKASVISARLN